MTRRAISAVGLFLLALMGAGCATGNDPSTVSAPSAPPTVSAPPSNDGQPTPDPTRPPVTSPPASPSRKPKSRPKEGPLGTMRMTGEKTVALTYDDGPHPDWTPKVLDQLRAANVKATFCVVGVKVRKYPQLVARMAREGHTLCNHSWQHDFKLGKRTPDQIRADLRRTSREIQRAAPGTPVNYYRQPGGMWTPAVVQVARQLGMTPLHWDVDPQDWSRPGASKIKQRTIGRARAGSVILLHDGGGDRRGTVEANPTIITVLKRKYGIAALK